jgi:tetratricopeptide (TPR) repeat protein
MATSPDPAALYNQGLVYKEQGKLAEAAECWRRTLELQPDNAHALNNLGNALREQGKLDDAAACFRQAIRLQGDVARLHYNLGNVLRDQGKLEESAAAYQRAVVLAPDYAQAHGNLGSVLRGLGRIDQATACWRRVVALKPDLHEAHNNLGNALRDRGEFDEAIACYSRAVQLRGDFVKALGNLGTALAQSGDFSGAEQCFRAALAHDPGNASAHFKLAELLGGMLPDEDFAAASRLLAAGNLADWQQMLLHYGLAKVFDARGDYAAAAGHLARANALQLGQWRKRGREYDPQEQQRLAAGLIELCTPEFFAERRDWGADSELPVLIVGLPRSGTTLVEQFLAAHSQVFAAGEIKLVHETLGAVARPDGDVIAGLRRADRQAVGLLAGQHLERLRAFSGTALRIVDKLPENYLLLGLLAVLFPRAKFIHCRRDLRDVAVSCWMTHFQEIRWANDQGHIAAQFRQYMGVMEHWRKVLPAPLLEIDYEQAVDDLEGTVRRLVAFCGLPWEPDCLEFHKAKRPVTTASAVQVRRPAYKSSVQRWRHYEPHLAWLFARLEGIT